MIVAVSQLHDMMIFFALVSSTLPILVVFVVVVAAMLVLTAVYPSPDCKYSIRRRRENASLPG